MDEYREFLKMLKSYQQSIQYLHRHCIGAEFFSTHEVTNDIYDLLADYIDEMCEVGMTFGVLVLIRGDINILGECPVMKQTSLNFHTMVLQT